MRKIGQVIRSSITEFINDDAMTLAGALAFYTALALAPLLLVAVWIVGLVYTGDTQQQALQRAEETVGPQGAEVIRTVLANAQQKGQSTIAAMIGLGTFVFFASGVFAQLQYSLNRIWNVQARANAPWWDWFRKRLWTLVMMAAINLIILASIVASAVLSTLQSRMSDVAGISSFWWVLNIAVPFFVYVLLFAAIYKILPDVEMGWRDVWWGALVTAILFAIGKWLIGWYIGRGTTASVYGAAGSLVALLTWLYYSALIFFFGAEVAQAIARSRGSRIAPSRHAEWIDPERAAAKTGQSRQQIEKDQAEGHAAEES